jgi:protein-S-isoprenylcysteine O-methyltransferase Ste14
MRLKILVGAGHRVMGLFVPFAVVGIALNIVFPSWFAMGLGTAGVAVGIILLTIGVPIWLVSAAQILIFVPRGKLITAGPFALVLHPLYTSVALLVIPGCGFLLDTWLGPALGIVLYVSSRIFSPEEERILEKIFPEDYPVYRKRVLLPWL